MAKKYSVEDVLKKIVDGNSSDMEPLGEDDDEEEGEEEEWTPAAEIGENQDSSDNDERLEEDTTLKSSASSEGKRKAYQWKRQQFEPPSVEFVEYVKEDSQERLGWTPYMYFKDFVTDEMLLEISEETNLYSMQKDGMSVNTNAQEIEQILGMYLHMGLVQMPNLRAYWEMETRYPAVCDVMSRGRFMNLLTQIHFQDNLNVSEEAKRDKVWKLRPWLEKLRQRFLCVPPEECHAVDQIIVPFKGKSHLRCYMPGKPHKWGFRMWGRIGQSGYLYDFDVCQGGENSDKEKSDVAGDVVLKMTSTLPPGRNHKVFADDFFTSVPLVEHLKQRGIYYIGTVRRNRVKNCQLMDERELRTKGRGSLDFRVNQENTIIVRWCNSKAVNLLSSFVGVEPLSTLRRWDQKAKTYTVIPRPAIVDAYNRFAGGLDLLDTLSALYKFSLRSRRWYIYIWWHTVTVAVINAWIRYRRDLEKLQPWQEPLPLRRFQASVGTALTSAGKVKKCSGPLSFPDATPAPPRKRKATEVPPDVRKDGLDHVPTWELRQRCKCCSGRLTHVYCQKCRVHLCLNKHRNCFHAYHYAK